MSDTQPAPTVPDEAVDRAHFHASVNDAEWHYVCYHDDPKECWKGDQARELVEGMLTAAAPFIVAANQPDAAGHSDLDAIAEKWLQQCGPCDGGLPMECSHPDEDIRPVLAALLAEVERLRAQRDAALALNVWRQNDGTTWVLADALRRALGARPS